MTPRPDPPPRRPPPQGPRDRCDRDRSGQMGFPRVPRPLSPRSVGTNGIPQGPQNAVTAIGRDKWDTPGSPDRCHRDRSGKPFSTSGQIRERRQKETKGRSTTDLKHQ